MANNKYIHEFYVDKIDEVDQLEERKDENGVVIEKVIKKAKQTVSHKFLIKKPNRILQENSEIFFAQQVSEGIRKGLMPVSLLNKRLENDGGSLTDIEQEEYKDLYHKFFEKGKIYQELVNKEAKTEEEKAAEETVKKEMESSFERLNILENKKNSFFNNTAETIARNRTIFWWMLHLSYIEENGEIKSLFGDGSFENKLKIYDDFEEKNDDFWINVIEKFSYYITAWYMGVKPEDFQSLPKYS